MVAMVLDQSRKHLALRDVPKPRAAASCGQIKLSI
jgi:hypothetical protein